MPKIIVNPNECAHQSNTAYTRKGSTIVPLCTHSRAKELQGCTNGRTFPKECPLSDTIEASSIKKELFDHINTFFDKK